MNINELLLQDTPEGNEIALSLLVERLNDAAEVLKKVVTFANSLTDSAEVFYHAGYIDGISDFGLFLTLGETP